jgi:hypothetical protein
MSHEQTTRAFNAERHRKKLVNDKIAELREKWNVMEHKRHQLAILKANLRFQWNDRAIMLLSNELDDLAREYASVNLFPKDNQEGVSFELYVDVPEEPGVIHYEPPLDSTPESEDPHE